ncbi:MAG: DUF302 domain-containing protein [Bacteriovoracia bacterium]
MSEYGFSKTIDRPFYEVKTAATKALKEEGFGVLSEIDVQAKLKEKLNVDYPSYVILGACNPPFAKKVLDIDPDMGLLLPCNVIVYEKDAQSVVSIIIPTRAMNMVNNYQIQAIAGEIEQKLKRVFNNI